FGEGAVHTLDGDEHRVRKAMFLGILTDPKRVDALVRRTAEAWDDASQRWISEPSVVLFDEAAQVITRAVCGWAGVPLDDKDVPLWAKQFVATVDGFATPSVRHLQARLARKRLEGWLTRLIVATRNGAAGSLSGTTGSESVVELVAHHRDTDGGLLKP